MIIMKLPFSDMLPCGVCDFLQIGELFDCRAKSRVPQGAKSVIVYLFPYWLGEEFYKNSNISKYAVPADYHIIAGEYLKKITEELKMEYPENQFEYFCDNSPVNEVKAAVLCGLGVKGKNGLLINEKYGSFCFIGEIVTDVKFNYSVPKTEECLNCGLCVKMCPGGALSENCVDKTKCLSDITQRKGELCEEHISMIKNSGCVWGCDICQDVCPMNKNILVTPVKEFSESAIACFCEGDSIEGRAFSWRTRKVIERNLEYLKSQDNLI